MKIISFIVLMKHILRTKGFISAKQKISCAEYFISELVHTAAFKKRSEF